MANTANARQSAALPSAAAPSAAAQSGGVPSGACRQLGSLEQRDIGPTFLRQMVERADANNATADDYDPKMRFHI